MTENERKFHLYLIYHGQYFHLKLCLIYTEHKLELQMYEYEQLRNLIINQL
jgi:hypothetical protein